MWFILDLIVIAIIVVFALLSAKRGFVRTIIEVVGFALVVLLANSVSTPLANVTYDMAVEPAIIKSVDNIEAEGAEALNIKFETLPGFVQDIIGDESIFADFENMVKENIGEGVEKAMSTASQNVIKPILTEILALVYSLLITVVLATVVNFLAGIINGFFKFSLIGKINRTLGAVFGTVKGCFIAAIFCSIISLIVSFTQNGFLIFTKEAIDKTLLFELLSFKIDFSLF